MCVKMKMALVVSARKKTKIPLRQERSTAAVQLKTRMSDPTELVLKDGSKKEIAIMLNERWRQGWVLDRVIDHGTEDTILIYYFKKSS